MELELDQSDYQALTGRVERALGRLDEIRLSGQVPEAVKHGLELMKTDGGEVLSILNAAAEIRMLPVTFFSEVDIWLEKVERVAPA